MNRKLLLSTLALLLAPPAFAQGKKDPPKTQNVNPPHISTDKSIKYDYDIVFVRAPRYGDEKRGGWAEWLQVERIHCVLDGQQLRRPPNVCPRRIV
jgi:hypothetical protein